MAFGINEPWYPCPECGATIQTNSLHWQECEGVEEEYEKLNGCKCL